MESKKIHGSCLKVIFGAESKMPGDQEIFNFFRKQNWKPDMLNAMFREPREYSVYVMFKTEQIMRQELLKCPTSMMFQYDNGQETLVTFAAAQGDFKYVRIFGLPIEIEDKHVAAVFAKYGKIQHMVRERYGADTGYPILNGVRGVHIELEAEIPSQIHIQHFQVRIFYAGMQNKCFVCGSTEHIKQNCPKRISINDRLNKATDQLSYAQSVALGAINKTDFPSLPVHMSILDKRNAPVPTTDPEVSQTENTTEQNLSNVQQREHNPTHKAAQTKEGNLTETTCQVAAPSSGQLESDMDCDGTGKEELEDVKGKKRSRKQRKQKVDGNGGQSSSDDVPVSSKKLVIPAAAHDLIVLQGRRSRSQSSNPVL